MSAGPGDDVRAATRLGLKALLQAARPDWKDKDLVVVQWKLAKAGITSVHKLAAALRDAADQDLNERLRAIEQKAFRSETLQALRRVTGCFECHVVGSVSARALEYCQVSSPVFRALGVGQQNGISLTDSAWSMPELDLRPKAAEAPFQSMADVRVGSHVRVLADEAALLQACQDAVLPLTPGMHKNLDASAGERALVLATDQADMCVLCRVPSVGDEWFPLGALTASAAASAHLDKPTGALPTHASRPRLRRTLLAETPTPARAKRESPALPKAAKSALPPASARAREPSAEPPACTVAKGPGTITPPPVAAAPTVSAVSEEVHCRREHDEFEGLDAAEQLVLRLEQCTFSSGVQASDLEVGAEVGALNAGRPAGGALARMDAGVQADSVPGKQPPLRARQRARPQAPGCASPTWKRLVAIWRRRRGRRQSGLPANGGPAAAARATAMASPATAAADQLGSSSFRTTVPQPARRAHELPAPRWQLRPSVGTWLLAPCPLRPAGRPAASPEQAVPLQQREPQSAAPTLPSVAPRLETWLASKVAAEARLRASFLRPSSAVVAQAARVLQAAASEDEKPRSCCFKWAFSGL